MSRCKLSDTAPKVLTITQQQYCISSKFGRKMSTETKARRQQQHRVEEDPKTVVDDIFGNLPSITKSGWCLREGLTHIITVDNGRMMPIVRQYGRPIMYELRRTTTNGSSPKQICRHDDDDENMNHLKNHPKNCFQSLCRIVAGQQLAGAAAKTVWNRLQETTEHDLTPTKVLKLADQGMEQYLQKPAGLSRAKARSIIALAEAFQEPNGDGIDNDLKDDIRLSDAFLTTAPDVELRDALLSVKGIGPWSCDVFMMFYLERPNILPVGDLGVRKGIAKLFQLRGRGKDGALCPKKDLALMENTLLPYQPYQSLVAYYMWKVADTKDFYTDDSVTNANKRKQTKSTPVVAFEDATTIAISTPKKIRTRRK
jgi:3-methyladenine DNA glycosylase/8-oxoguanine DNA glycosylase